MPEMPEVETIRRSLAELVGESFRAIDILNPRQIHYPTEKEFKKRLLNSPITGLNRRGKYLLIELANGYSLVFHLRMTGKIIYLTENVARPTHIKAIFELTNGRELVFSDIRAFGTLDAISKDETPKIKGLSELAPEPLAADFTLDYLLQTLGKSRLKLKAFLLDQRKVAGLGNIYVDEALFLAKLHPERLAQTVDKKAAKALYQAINQVIADGIRDGGTTFRDYRSGDGSKGSHQDNLFAYGRGGEPCKRCKTTLAKIKVAGRATVYCPKCQK